MSRQIKITDKQKEQMMLDFAKALDDYRAADGKITYEAKLTSEFSNKAVIEITPKAYAKMIALISSFDSEVAWYGCGCRVDKAKFRITDILVYPQIVTGSTVENDVERYAKWLYDNRDDERFDNIIMQGHSHVNFGTTPSGTDLQHQSEILSDMGQNMFYIFLIWNKKLEKTTKIYDLENNILYDNGDITYSICDDDYDLDAFITEAKTVAVKNKPPEPTKAEKLLGIRVDPNAPKKDQNWYKEDKFKHYDSYSDYMYYFKGGY